MGFLRDEELCHENNRFTKMFIHLGLWVMWLGNKINLINYCVWF